MNKDLILIFLLINVFLYVCLCSSLDSYDKKMISIWIISYLSYLLIHQIPNFEYVNLKNDN